MRLLIIDSDACALDIAMRAQIAGHDVLMWQRPHKNGDECMTGEGIVPRVRDFDSIKRKWLDWADLIYMPHNEHYVSMLEPYRAAGYPIYACNEDGRKWEVDRAEGQRVMQEAGLNVIPGEEFYDYDSAIDYVKSHGKAFVSKPSGEADKAMSYVADSAADLVYMLEKWSKNKKYVADAREHGFILQEKKTGCEMGIGGWFGPAGWCGYWEENFEYKKLMDGDLGVNTGEQGTLLRFVRESKLAKVALLPLTKALKEIGYVGCVDVNGCIDEKGNYWPFEFTMRDGWPATHNHMALHEGDPIQWMLDLLNGEDTRKVRFDECSISVVVTIPEYPYSHMTAKEVAGIPIYGAGDKDHVHLCEAMLGECPVQAGKQVVQAPNLVTAGDYPLVVTGTGETITGARRSAYTAVSKIKIPNSPQWRLDIGRAKLVEALPRIQRLGFATGLTY